MRSQTKLTLGVGSQLLKESDGQLCTSLESKDTEVLELFRRDRVEFDLLWVPSPNSISTTNVTDKLWVTLYGEKDLATGLGEVLQHLDIYLQDPIHAERDVPYWNPHSFHNDIDLRTSDLKQDLWVEQKAERLSISVSDILAEFVSEDSLPKTEGSPLLLTSLKE